jgi:murein L,D-transpeptidase YcbB/YkuD
MLAQLRSIAMRNIKPADDRYRCRDEMRNDIVFRPWHDTARCRACNQFHAALPEPSLLLVVLLSLLVAAFARADVGAADPVRTRYQSETGRSDDGLTAQEELRTLAGEHTLPELRWPDFSDYRIQVQKFYEPAAYAPAWTENARPTPQAHVLIAVFAQADSKGLNPGDYDATRWSARLEKLRQSPAVADLAHFDLALTVSVMRYISDLHLGRVNPHYFHFGFDVEHNQYDLSDFVRERLVNSRDVMAALATVEPPFEGYHRTEKALGQYLQLALRDNGERLTIPKGLIAPGDRYVGAKRLQQLLCLLGDLQPDACLPEAADVYTGSLADGVAHFQARHGLQESAHLDNATVREMNVPLRERVAQLQLTLERWRWLPHEFPQPPIIVNIPEFRLRALDQNNNVVLAMNVVVGRAYRHQTPVFAKDMQFVVFRPYWNVPLSIQRGEIVPAIQRDRSYLAKKNYEVVTHSGVVLTSEAIGDDILQQLRDGTLAVRQRPGPNNALGLVKLIFPNEYNVYLHSTPAPELFTRPRRDFSHGCIRVENPVELTTWVLRNNSGWDKTRVQSAMQTGKDNYQVNLREPIPVLILYGTAIVDDKGEVHFFDDVYGHDAALKRALAKGYPYPSK